MKTISVIIQFNKDNPKEIEVINLFSEEGIQKLEGELLQKIIYAIETKDFSQTNTSKYNPYTPTLEQAKEMYNDVERKQFFNNIKEGKSSLKEVETIHKDSKSYKELSMIVAINQAIELATTRLKLNIQNEVQDNLEDYNFKDKAVENDEEIIVTVYAKKK